MNFSTFGAAVCAMILALGLALLAYYGPIEVEAGRRTRLAAFLVNPVVEQFGSNGATGFFAIGGLLFAGMLVLIGRRF